MFSVFGKILHMAIKLTWGITKVVFTLIFLPFIVIGLAVAGFMYLSILVLIVAGFFAFVGGLVFG
jgi:hypothetical protein